MSPVGALCILVAVEEAALCCFPDRDTRDIVLTDLAKYCERARKEIVELQRRVERAERWQASQRMVLIEGDAGDANASPERTPERKLHAV